jgi:hypothetical protein
MHFTLIVSDLIPPPTFIAAQDLPPMPGLQSLLTRGEVKKSAGRFLEEACLNELGLVFVASNPVASLTLLADGGTPEYDTWIRADPVHLHVSRDNVQLLDSHVLAPTQDEADAIVATLNNHLANDQLTIEARDAARWYMHIPESETPETTPLWRANGANVFDHLPEDSNGKINWRRLQNELQMLLHDHPVNTAREARGELAINGIWFWGAGAFRGNAAPSGPNKAHMLGVVNKNNILTPPRVSPGPKKKNPHELVLAKLALVRGLALNAKLPLISLPTNLNAFPIQSLNTLVVLHSATRALRANQRHEWMTEVSALDTNWFVPLKAALDDGTISSLTLILPSEAATLRTDIVPPSQWDVRAQASQALAKLFARSAKSLSSYI